MTPYSSPLHNLEDVALLILCKPQSVSTLKTFLGNWAIACREGAVDQKSVALQAFKFVIPWKGIPWYHALEGQGTSMLPIGNSSTHCSQRVALGCMGTVNVCNH